MKTACASILLLASMAMATDHVVLVGSTGLTFSPDQINATVGDTVSFQFVKGNHSVAQSTFAKPCTPNGGIWSGFEPVVAAAPAASSSSAAATSTGGGDSGYGYKMVKREGSEVPQFQITINATTPLWFYCAQAEHCQSGMVFAVNVNNTSGKTLDAYKAAAAKATANVAPTFAAQGGVQSEVTESAGATATGTGSSATATASSAATNLHQFGGSAVSTLFASVVFGAVGLMVVF